MEDRRKSAVITVPARQMRGDKCDELFKHDALVVRGWGERVVVAGARRLGTTGIDRESRHDGA